MFSPPYRRTTAPARSVTEGPQPDSTTGRRARQADARSREGPFVRAPTDRMGVNASGTSDSGVGNAAAPATDAPAPATGAATGTAPRRRRSGTGLDAMVLAELQQLASRLGIKGTARMRKSQLIEVIKEKQAASGGGAQGSEAAPSAAEGGAKAKRRRP